MVRITSFKICILLIQGIIVTTYAAPAAELTKQCENQSLTPTDSNRVFGNLTAQGDEGSDEADYPDIPSLRRDLTTTTTSLHRRAGGPAWQSAVNDGRDLWNKLQGVLDNQYAKDRSISCSLQSRWQDFVAIRQPKTITFDWEKALGRSTGVIPDYDVTAPAWIPTSLTSPPGGDWTWAYFNDYSTEYGAIHANYNKGAIPKAEGGVSRAPDRWSDVTYAYWRLACAYNSVAPSTLQYILRQSITNRATLTIIDAILSSSTATSDPDPEVESRATLTPHDEADNGAAFYALLKTPNVIGVMHMLMSYPNGLGRKNVAAIHLTKLPEPGIVFAGVSVPPSYFLVVELENFVAVGGGFGGGGVETA